MLFLLFSEKVCLILAVFSSILILSSVTANTAYATVAGDPGTYMNGQRIAT